MYALGRLVAFFVPRAPERWVFGSGAGIAEGALAVYREVRDTRPDIRLTWLVSTDAQAAAADAAGISWVRRDSIAGWWQTLRASTLIITHGFGDVNRYGVFGAFVVQLWHGIPLKKLHLDTEVTLSSSRGVGGVLRRMYRAGGKATSLFVVPSDTVGERMRTAFSLDPSVIAPIGDPRDDALILADPQKSRAEVLRLLGIDDDRSRLVLYAPTWRDGDTDPGVPSDGEWLAIEEWAANFDARVVIRSHPLGMGSYARVTAERTHVLPASLLADVTPVLGAFDAVVTDYSSLAFDYSLTGGPIVWFAPDLESYTQSRGFYEPYETVTEGAFACTWVGVLEQLSLIIHDPAERAASCERSERLATRLFRFRDGHSARRVVAEITRRRARGALSAREGRGSDVSPAQDANRPSAVYFESFYGRQVACNPRALDAEIARVAPNVTRYWGVHDAAIEVPEGAVRVVEGTPKWRQARERADLIITNDWLKKTFSVAAHQRVLQTWHGTMLKKLALERSNVSLRTRLATLRESRKWNIVLSQNAHCTTHLRRSYGYHGPIWQVGYPRDDELVTLDQKTAKQRLGIPLKTRVVTYAPTWREQKSGLIDLLDVAEFARTLPSDWLLLVRGHTRTFDFGSYPELGDRVRDVSRWPNVNDVLAASDLFVTDYSSLMFDASVARIPMAFFVPDLTEYQKNERGFTFDFQSEAPGPVLTTASELLRVIERLDEVVDQYRGQYDRWRDTYNPHDDGHAAERVVQRLIDDGYLRP